MKKLFMTLLFLTSIITFGFAQNCQQVPGNKFYWPTCDSRRTSQIYSEAPTGGTWLSPYSDRYTQDERGSVRVGNYFPGVFHLGFDILNDSNEQNHPIYSLADGQIVKVSYGAPGDPSPDNPSGQDINGAGGWGNTDCSEIKTITPSAKLPTDCTTYARAGNVGLVVKYLRANGKPFYAVYGHLIDTNQTPRAIYGASSTDEICNTSLTLENASSMPDVSNVQQIQKRPFQPCDVFAAGELIGYTGDYPTRHLHFSISPGTFIITNLGRYSYNSATWPDDGSIVNCIYQGVGHNCLPTGEYQNTSEENQPIYVDQVNPIDFIIKPENKPYQWVQALNVQSTITYDTFVFSDLFLSPYNHNWIFSTNQYPPLVVYGIGRLMVATAEKNDYGTMISHQNFSGDIDVTFTFNHSGGGLSGVGLYDKSNDSFIIQAKTDENDTGYWAFHSNAHNYDYFDSVANDPMNRVATVRIKTDLANNQASFYVDGDSNPIQSVLFTGDLSNYSLAFFTTWRQGDSSNANITNVYNIEAKLATLLAPSETTPTIGNFTAATAPEEAISFKGTLSGTDFDTNVEVWFCKNATAGICYQQPAAGVAFVNSTSISINAITLSLGSWKVKTRNGSNGAWSNFSDNFDVGEQTATLLNETFSSTPNSNWNATASPIYSPSLVWGEGDLNISTTHLGADEQMFSNQSYTGDIDVSFSFKHSGAGQTRVGLYSSTSGFFAEVQIDEIDPGYLVLKTNRYANTIFSQVNSGPLGETQNIRIKTIGDIVEFYSNGALIQRMYFTNPQSYSVGFEASSGQGYDSSTTPNVTDMYSIVVASGTILQ